MSCFSLQVPQGFNFLLPLAFCYRSVSGRDGCSYLIAVLVLPWSGHQTPTGIAAWRGEPFNALLRCFPLGIYSPECAGKFDWCEQGCPKCVFVYRNNYAGVMLSACTDWCSCAFSKADWSLAQHACLFVSINPNTSPELFMVRVFHMDYKDFKHRPDCRSLERARALGCPPCRLSSALSVDAHLQENHLNWKDLFAFYVRETDEKPSLS